MTEAEMTSARAMMVDCQIRPFDVTDQAVIAAFLDVPREAFAPLALGAIAYADCAVRARGAPDRMLAAPMILARLLQGADIQPGESVLDVAGGSFFTAALAARLGGKVVALEAPGSTGDRAGLAAHGAGVEVVAGPIEAGWPKGAPYDCILVNGGLELRPDALLAQLKDGGRLLCCDMSSGTPRLMRFERNGAGFGASVICGGSIAPLAEFRRVQGFVF